MTGRHRIPWGVIVLVVTLAFTVWWRGHTIGPSVKQGLGFALWPVVTGETEPLDCDESAYAYIGKRLVHGDTMYRDLTENKPPLGYWLYALAVGIGGCNELTVRLLPVPLVLGTVALLWWIGRRLGGVPAGAVAGATYAVASADPYLYGNGAQLEQAMNFFSCAGFAALLKGIHPEPSHHRRWLLGAGALLGLASLVKQVAALHVLVLSVMLLIDGRRDTLRSRVVDALLLMGGAILPWAVVAGVLAMQGALHAGYEDMIRYGGALAGLPPEPGSPPLWQRIVTGNADPRGNLPPPFGRSSYLVWWGRGTWPFWLIALPCLVWLAVSSTTARARRLSVAWAVASCVQVALPGLFWPHYYLLPLPGLAVATGVGLGRAVERIHHRERRAMSACAALAIAVGLTWMVVIQVQSYLLVPAEELAIRAKGGGQWIFLREMGRELARRTSTWHDPRLYVWGIQSPLFVYGRFDGVTPQVFADNLIRDRAGRSDPLIEPRTDRIVADLRRERPELVFAGYPPFPELLRVLSEAYVPAHLRIAGHELPPMRGGMGLWVRADRASMLEQETPPTPRANPREGHASP